MPRILVLDDEPLISMMMTEWLTELGCETVGPAHSVQGAMILMEGTPLDAAILDVTLGNNEKSYPVAHALLARGIPFAFGTGYESIDIDPLFRDAILLSKPFDFAALNAITKLLGRPPPKDE